jgi:hypothetical protein
VEVQVLESRQEKYDFYSQKKMATLSGDRTAFYSMGTEIPSMGQRGKK